jgi:hypothetical protein
MTHIQAIETEYKSYRFRSRKEARFAVMLDALDIAWRYEPEGFALSNGMDYLPDFLLPDVEAWIEIKGTAPNEEDFEKATALCLDSKNPVFITWTDFDEDTLGDNVTFCLDENEVFTSQQGSAMWQYLWPHIGPWCDIDDGWKAARAARFEHGECGTFHYD